MKGSLITSAILHLALLIILLFKFGSVEPLQVTSSEAMPVELVPVQDVSQVQQGDKDAPKKEQASKDVTKKQDEVKDAQNAGENKFDLKSVPVPTEKPDNLQQAGAPEKSDKIVPDKADKPVVAEKTKEDPQVEPATELAAEATPKVDVKPEARPDPAKTEDKPADEAKADPVPDNVPVPSLRPTTEDKPKTEEKKDEPKKAEEKKKVEDKKPVEVAEAKTAKTEVRKKTEKNEKSAKMTTTKDSDFNTDAISDLLNKTDSNPGGAKRSKNSKSFGAEKTTGGQTLSQDEMDALKGLIEKNWSIMPGQVTSNDILITVKMNLDQNGEIVGDLEVSSKGGDPSTIAALEGGARRAVMRSAPFDKLPKDKYDTWSQVIINFNPSDMM